MSSNPGGFVAGMFVGCIFVGAMMAGMDEDTDSEASVPTPPAPATVTKTVTEEVTKEVPVWSDECTAFANLVDSTWTEIDAYEDGVAPQQSVLYDTLGAIINQDLNGINQGITDQQAILNATAGPLGRIIENQPDLAKARDACLATIPEDK